MMPQRPIEIDSTESVRQGLIELRDVCFEQWPEAIPETVLLSHAIALLHYLIELEKELELKEKV
jgi:hypothetical protein